MSKSILRTNKNSPFQDDTPHSLVILSIINITEKLSNFK